MPLRYTKNIEKGTSCYAQNYVAMHPKLCYQKKTITMHGKQFRAEQQQQV